MQVSLHTHSKNSKRMDLNLNIKGAVSLQQNGKHLFSLLVIFDTIFHNVKRDGYERGVGARIEERGLLPIVLTLFMYRSSTIAIIITSYSN